MSKFFSRYQASVATCRRVLVWLLFAPAVAVAAPPPYVTASAVGSGTLVEAVEYFYSDWNHYFVTANPAEISALDGGAFGGVWKRTGQSFSVMTDRAADALPTCRFFSSTFDPKSSHFYTVDADECAQLQSGTAWQYEGIAFYLLPPDAYDYCPKGTDEVYRLYNNGMGGAPNHRYTTNLLTVWEATRAAWLLEGYDWDHYTGTFACAPTKPVPWTSAEGLWNGLGSDRWIVDVGIVLDDGRFYFFYSLPESANVGGLVYGTGASVDGDFTSTDARGPGLMGFSAPLTLSGSYRAHATLQGFVSSGNGGTAFAVNYNTAYDRPANLASAAGTYSGSALSSSGEAPAVLALSGEGVVSGTIAGCSFTGTALPRGTVNVYNLLLSFSGGGCAFGTSTLTGIAYYEEVGRRISIAAPNAARTDLFLFTGTKL